MYGRAGQLRPGLGIRELHITDNPLTVNPIPYRHSRVSGNPRIPAGSILVFGSTVGIPAYAGMTVEGGGKMTVAVAGYPRNNFNYAFRHNYS